METVDDIESGDDDDDDDNDENGDARLQFPTELPTFSKKILNCLQSGDFWHKSNESSQLVSELAVFYWHHSTQKLSL